MLKKLLLVLCASGLAFGAIAAEGGASAAATGQPVTPAAQQMVRQLIATLSSKARVDLIEPAPMPGFYRVIASGQMLYVSADGKYLLNGDLLDMQRKKNLNDDAWARFRTAELAKVPAAERIVYAPAHPRYTVTVFTDITCPFCRALHEHIAAFNKAGIAVEYLAWPREGLTTTAGRPTPVSTEMASIWCAGNRQQALTAAFAGHAPKPASCSNPVGREFELGVRLGVSGTPTIIGPNGHTLGGYLTPEQLLAALQKGG
ncbi:MAG: DsbC family protein [Pseudomonadota bacterium]|nr:DsbC family protein [Pseudomonadota bacterium]